MRETFMALVHTMTAGLEPFPLRWNPNAALGFCFDAFSRREPVTASLENAHGSFTTRSSGRLQSLADGAVSA
jgi:hypothetical protein